MIIVNTFLKPIEMNKMSEKLDDYTMNEENEADLNLVAKTLYEMDNIPAMQRNDYLNKAKILLNKFVMLEPSKWDVMLFNLGD